MNIKKIVPKFIKNIYNNYHYYNFIKKNKLNVMSDEETINKIITEKKSIARFGDGEFKWILNVEQKSFQKNTKKLSTKLKSVLEEPSNKLLVCIPIAFNNLNGYTESSSQFWKKFIRWYGKKVINLLNKEYFYGNASFTRWYLEHKDKTDMQKKLNNLKQIWDKKNILIIEGKDTKMGVGNNLFDNVKSIKRIICPSTNAFDKYDEILNNIKKFDNNLLILIALGPTATILAYDLSNLGYQAIDIGHIDIEYEWFLKNAKTKILIQGKYVNEAGGISDNNKINDNNYQKSIVCKIED